VTDVARVVAVGVQAAVDGAAISRTPDAMHLEMAWRELRRTVLRPRILVGYSSRAAGTNL
jgi:hypothetical protein